MSDDEQAIRKLLETWMTATEKGDLLTVLSLMADDVVFLVPGMPPFGKVAFATAFAAMQAFVVEAKSDPAEIGIHGDWAYLRNHLTVTMTPRLGEAQVVKRAGYTLTILRKKANGTWVVTRDANLMTPAV